MNAATSRKMVVWSLVATTGVVVVQRASKGSWPDPRTFFAVAIVYVILGFISDVAPNLAGPFAVLAFLAILLQVGPDAFKAKLHTLTIGDRTEPATNVAPGGTNATTTRGQGGSPAANRRLAQALAASLFGWVGAEWTALDKLWTRESGFDSHAVNASSGATGIPQRMHAPAGWASVSARVQIIWGLRYIRARYGRPTKALAHSDATGWY